MGFFDEPFGRFRKPLSGEESKSEWITPVVDRRTDERSGALAHQTGIRAINQDDRQARIGPRHKTFDVGGFERDHRILRQAVVSGQVPATK
jgi:hypothetical protein